MERTHDRETIVEIPVVKLSAEEEAKASGKYSDQMDSREVNIR